MARKADLYGGEPMSRTQIRKLLNQEEAVEAAAETEDPFPREFFRWYHEQVTQEKDTDE